MTKNRPLIRRWIQALLLAFGAFGLTQCVDGATGPESEYSTFGVAPTWNAGAPRAMHLLEEGGLPLDRVRIILVRPVADTLKDTTITVHRGDPEVELPLIINVTPGTVLQATLQFKSGETILFEGTATVTTVSLSRQPTPASLPMDYVGPGKDATLVTVSPSSGLFLTGTNITFTATVKDAANNSFPNTPIDWTVGDATFGAFIAGGIFVPSGKTGTVTITATTPTNISGSATITLAQAAQPASIAIVSGNAQIDTVLKTLAAPFVVKVADALGNGVPGVTVTWARTGGFGTPANATSTTNAAGLASLIYRLGDIGGADTVVASVAGVSTTVQFTATVRDGLGLPVVTGFAYLLVKPSPKTSRVGDTVTFTVDSVSAGGQATPVTAQWASNHPGRGVIDATGRLIVADTGDIIITATRNAIVGHARVTVLPAPKLTGFSFAPKVLNGITNSPLTASLTFSGIDAGSGITSATFTLTSPTGTTKTCTVNAPTTGTSRDGVFDCAVTLPAGSPAGVWHITSLVLNGSITRTFGESVLALFSTTTLTVNP